MYHQSILLGNDLIEEFRLYAHERCTMPLRTLVPGGSRQRNVRYPKTPLLQTSDGDKENLDESNSGLLDDTSTFTEVIGPHGENTSSRSSIDVRVRFSPDPTYTTKHREGADQHVFRNRDVSSSQFVEQMPALPKAASNFQDAPKNSNEYACSPLSSSTATSTCALSLCSYSVGSADELYEYHRLNDFTIPSRNDTGLDNTTNAVKYDQLPRISNESYRQACINAIVSRSPEQKPLQKPPMNAVTFNAASTLESITTTTAEIPPTVTSNLQFYESKQRSENPKISSSATANAEDGAQITHVTNKKKNLTCRSNQKTPYEAYLAARDALECGKALASARNHVGASSASITTKMTTERGNESAKYVRNVNGCGTSKAKISAGKDGRIMGVKSTDMNCKTLACHRKTPYEAYLDAKEALKAGRAITNVASPATRPHPKATSKNNSRVLSAHSTTNITSIESSSNNVGDDSSANISRSIDISMMPMSNDAKKCIALKSDDPPNQRKSFFQAYLDKVDAVKGREEISKAYPENYQKSEEPKEPIVQSQGENQTFDSSSSGSITERAKYAIARQCTCTYSEYDSS